MKSELAEVNGKTNFYLIILLIWKAVCMA